MTAETGAGTLDPPRSVTRDAAPSGARAPAAPALQVEWRALAALEPLAGAWRNLAGRAIEPNVFYHPAFALPAARVFGADVRAALVWGAAAPPRLLGLFPVRIAHRYGPLFPVLTGWTHPYAPLGTPLADRDVADEVIEAFLEAVALAPLRCRLVRLPLVPDDGPFAAALDRALAIRRSSVARFERHARALLDPGGRRSGYLDGAGSAKRRKEWRRLRRRLESAGTVTLATARCEPEFATALAEFIALEARGWKGRAGTAMSELPDIRRFVEQALPRLAADGLARIDRLRLADHTVAAAITLRCGDTAWFWKTAFDEDHADVSPGVQLTLDLTGSLLADRSIARVDSCAVAGHPMIDHLWQERRALSDRLITTGPDGRTAWLLARRLEGLRGRGIAAARQLRDLVRRR